MKLFKRIARILSRRNVDTVEAIARAAGKAVLEAIQNRSLSIPFAEGVMMKIEVSYKERKDGNLWRVVAGTRRVNRVLSPRITLPPPGSSFADSDRP